jgi:hypothetical protein
VEGHVIADYILEPTGQLLQQVLREGEEALLFFHTDRYLSFCQCCQPQENPKNSAAEENIRSLKIFSHRSWIYRLFKKLPAAQL